MAYKLLEGKAGAEGFAKEGGWKDAAEMADEVGLDLNDIEGLYFECGEMPKTWVCDVPAMARFVHKRVPMVFTCHRSYSIIVAKVTQVVDKGLVLMTIIADDVYGAIAP